MSIHKIALFFVVAANCGVDIEICEGRVIELVAPARCRLGSRGGGRFGRFGRLRQRRRRARIRHVARLADMVDARNDAVDLVPLQRRGAA